MERYFLVLLKRILCGNFTSAGAAIKRYGTIQNNSESVFDVSLKSLHNPHTPPLSYSIQLVYGGTREKKQEKDSTGECAKNYSPIGSRCRHLGCWTARSKCHRCNGQTWTSSFEKAERNYRTLAYSPHKSWPTCLPRRQIEAYTERGKGATCPRTSRISLKTAETMGWEMARAHI